jgi:hypothetical protein
MASEQHKVIDFEESDLIKEQVALFKESCGSEERVTTEELNAQGFLTINQFSEYSNIPRNTAGDKLRRMEKDGKAESKESCWMARSIVHIG